MNASSNPVFVALDTTDLDRAMSLLGAIHDQVGGIKIGLEFFCHHGHAGIQALRQQHDFSLFLDLKFHDIPNTVAGAVRATMPLAPTLLNVHASGGAVMMKAARDCATEEGVKHGLPIPKMLAVTILTSLSQDELAETGVAGPVLDQVRRLADLAHRSGMDGVVCSAREAEILRKDQGPDFLLVTPGVRPDWSDQNDQKRIMTPQQALKAGANILVLGRPITGATDPRAAASRLRTDLQGED